MTLVLTAIGLNEVVQASDRRLTTFGPESGETQSVDDNENKAVCVRCRDAVLSIAYTGVASIALAEGRQKTDHWLTDVLTELRPHVSERPVCDVIAILADEASEAFGRDRDIPLESQGTTFVLAGVRRGQPFVAVVSNAAGADGRPLRQVRRHFVTGQYPVRPGVVTVHGCEDAEEVARERYRACKGKPFLLPTQPKALADRLVELIRMASWVFPQGQYIGRNCMSVVIGRNGGVQPYYHPEAKEPWEYMPNLVGFGPASFRDIAIGLGVPPPDWGKKP